jgi:hypothetical protein
MTNPSIVLSIAVVAAALAVTPALAQTKPAQTRPAAAPAAPAQAKPAPAPAAPEAEEEAAGPEESPLAVGSLEIGSAPNLVVAGFDINVATDSIAYTYSLKNTGSTELAITAAVSLPELEASTDGSEIWVLASDDPENPVGLTITAGGAPVTTKAEVHAYALGIDRVAEIQAEHLPLIPFGPQAERALAALSSEAADRLASLGIVSPRDPAQPRAPLTAAWSLDVVRSWRQVLPPGQTTPVVVKFTPVKAQYRMDKDDEEDLDGMKTEICLKPQVLNNLRTRLRSNGAWKVTDMLVAAQSPTEWVHSAPAAISVQKPSPNSVVAFCGMDEKTAGRSTVVGAALEGDDDEDEHEIRIVVFEPVIIYEPKQHRR